MRSIHAIPGLRRLINSLLKSLTMFLNIVAFLVFFLHFSIIHLHDLFEDLGGVDTHLLGNLEDLRIKLLKINVVEVDLVFIFFLFLIVMVVLVIAIIIFVHLSQLLL
jgi:hypothetical protein